MIEPSPPPSARRSVAAIREVAEQFRRVVDHPADVCFPIMHVIESKLDQQLDVLRFEVWPDDEMRGYEGLTFRNAGRDRLVLADQVYRSACLGQWRARRIAAHELGHWLLHTPYFRGDAFGHAAEAANDAAISWLEDEADVFAVELLLPMNQIGLDDTALDLCVRFGAPRGLAEARLAAARNVWRKERATLSGSPWKLVTG